MLAGTVSTSASAEGYFRLGALYWSEEVGDPAVKSSRTLLDLGGGYIWPSGLTLGGLYGTEKRKAGDSSWDRLSYGPTLGWMQKGEGFYILGTYFFKSEYEDYEGTGIEADLGYRFKISSVGVGLQFAYKQFEYTKLNGASVSPAYKQTYIDPYFTFWFEF